jgi:hypothetical protein
VAAASVEAFLPRKKETGRKIKFPPGLKLGLWLTRIFGAVIGS